jgi:hypothetical protein
MRTATLQNNFSLTPGFSPVSETVAGLAVSTALRADEKTVETVFPSVFAIITGLKPGVNENRIASRICQ